MRRILVKVSYLALLVFSMPSIAQNSKTDIKMAIPVLKATNYVGYECGQTPSESVLRHSEDSYGHNGTYIRVTFPKHPSEKANLVVSFSFMIEKDPFKPKYPTQGNVKNINWGDLKPLSFQVTEDGRVFYGFKENARDLKTTTHLDRKRTNWDSFDVYVPWELFSLGYLFDTPEKQALGCYSINIFLRADVYQNMRLIGTNKNIPITRYVYDVPSSGMKIKDLGSEDISSLFEEEPPKTYEYERRDSFVAVFAPEWEEDGGGGSEEEDEETIIVEPRPRPSEKREVRHQHHFTTSVSFGIPVEVKTQKPIRYAFPESVAMSIDKKNVVFEKAESDIGDNIYIGQYSMTAKTKEDAEQNIAHLNDSLKRVGTQMSLRLPTKKEVSKVTQNVVYSGEEDFEYYFNPESPFFLVLEYNKDRSGTAVVPDHVKVVETHTQKCSCGERRVFSYTRKFKSMLLCRLYMNKKRK